MVEMILQLPRMNQHVNSLVSALKRFESGDFRALIAFLRRSELTEKVFSAMNAFCRRGGRIDWLVGTDLGGTDGTSLRRLLRFQRRFPANRVRIVKLGGSATFHPKFYWVSRRAHQFALIGSANFTGGGLGTNLELSIKIEAKG